MKIRKPSRGTGLPGDVCLPLQSGPSGTCLIALLLRDLGRDRTHCGIAERKLMEAAIECK